MMATTFWSPDGKPMSAAQFIERLFGDLPELFKDEDELRTLWSQPDTRMALLDSLSERGYGEENLSEIRRMIDAENSDLYDVLAYIAFALAPITRHERVATRKERIFSDYDEKLQAFLDFVLAQYVKEGVGELDSAKLPDLLELKYHTLNDAAAQLGGVGAVRDAFVGFQRSLYDG
jgi:type I restriction enzyme R subunit